MLRKVCKVPATRNSRGTWKGSCNVLKNTLDLAMTWRTLGCSVACYSRVGSLPSCACTISEQWTRSRAGL